jgi:hypothetical protein
MEDFDWQDHTLTEADDVKHQLTGSITQQSLDFLESYSHQAGNNLALAIIIESLSEALGNMISLVEESHQSETINCANQVILQGIVSQHKIVAHLVYGYVGNA